MYHSPTKKLIVKRSEPKAKPGRDQTLFLQQKSLEPVYPPIKTKSRYYAPSPTKKIASRRLGRIRR